FELEYFTFGHGSRNMAIIPGVSMTSIMLSAGAIAGGFEIFTDRYTVYVFDQQKNIDENYSVAVAADNIATAMKQIGIKDVDVFGASHGGMVAQYLAIHYPELIHALYLGGTKSRNNPSSPDTINRWMELAKGNDVCALNHDIYQSLYSDEFYEKFAGLFAEMEKNGGPKEMERFYHMVRSAAEFDCYDDLDKITCPVFAIGSKVDKVLGGYATQEIADKLGCYIYMYEGYGHAFYDEAADFRPTMLENLSALD
ncbi:MAG: alpha/beta hydrolase, partial [Lachnospiraceae bacterium]|nr:alpha/beta hydrolase [Candidatus Equihabitans merdae]